MNKPEGVERCYALSSGDYLVSQRSEASYLVHRVHVPPGGEVLVQARDMTPAKSVVALTKGLSLRHVYRPEAVHGPVSSVGIGWGGASDLAAGPSFALGYRADLPYPRLSMKQLPACADGTPTTRAPRLYRLAARSKPAL